MGVRSGTEIARELNGWAEGHEEGRGHVAERDGLGRLQGIATTAIASIHKN